MTSSLHTQQQSSTSPYFVALIALKLLPSVSLSAHSCRPVFSVLADSEEESSSAGSSDEEELLASEPQGPVGEKGSAPAAEG